MIKLLYNDDNAALVKAAGAMATLIEDGRFVKRASSSAISERLILDNLPDKDHFAQHVIAMGTEEAYGPNRNFDGWPEEGLRKKHATFVTHGHFFREHRNSDPALAIGKVKASAFNDDMNRVELIIWGDKKKAAEEYEMAKSGKQLSYSMSARVPGDICNCCKKFSKRSSDYCACMKKHAGQYMPKFKKFAYVTNPDPTFFDISRVKNPADRIAHYLEYRFNDADLQKAASAEGQPFFSDQLATAAGVIIPDDSFGCIEPAHQQWLTKLAGIEERVEAVMLGSAPKDAYHHFVKEAAAFAFQPSTYSEADMESLKSIDVPMLLTGLAKRGSSLPFVPFCAYALGITLKQAAEDQDIKQACSLLPTLFRDLAKSPVDQAIEQMFTPDMCSSGCNNSDPIEKFMDSVGDRESIFGDQATPRIMTIVIDRGGHPAPVCDCAEYASCKNDVSQKARNLAKIYGIYKVAFCAAAEQAFHNKTVDDAAATLLVYSNLINQ